MAIKYILDTGFFTLARNHYPGIYVSFWKKLDEAVKEGLIASVREVKREIKSYGGEQQKLLQWIKQNKHLFQSPSEEEQKIISDLYSDRNIKLGFLIEKRKLLTKDPFADPFVIAKAKHENATVVTNEKPAKRDKNDKIQGVYKIPDICKHLNIKCVSLRGFMEEMKWQF